MSTISYFNVIRLRHTRILDTRMTKWCPPIFRHMRTYNSVRNTCDILQIYLCARRANASILNKDAGVCLRTHAHSCASTHQGGLWMRFRASWRNTRPHYACEQRVLSTFYVHTATHILWAFLCCVELVASTTSKLRAHTHIIASEERNSIKYTTNAAFCSFQQ